MLSRYLRSVRVPSTPLYPSLTLIAAGGLIPVCLSYPSQNPSLSSRAGSATTIIQEIIIDDMSLLFVIYELDRISGNPMPSAQFIGFLKYPTLRASSSGSMPTSFSNRHFSSTTNDSSGSSIRAFSANSSTSAGLTSIVHPSSYSYNPLPNTYSHSTVMAMSNSDAIGSSGLCADPVHMHSHHGRHSSQSLAQALTPIRASSSPS